MWTKYLSVAMAATALSVSATPGVRAQMAFNPIGSFAAGVGTQFVLARDLNADRKADLIVVNNYSNTVSILSGTGTGSCVTPVNYAVGSGPTGACIADFNGDGRLDIAVTSRGTNSISLLRNTGGISYTSAGSYAAGTYPTAVQAADVTGDKKPDLVVANLTTNTVSVLVNTGTTFAAPRTYATGAGPNSVAIADFNRDTRPDIATANQNARSVSVLLSTGAGTFAAPRHFTGVRAPYAVAAADVNGDGRLDILTADNSLGGVNTYLGLGDGNFQAPTNNGARGECDTNTTVLNTYSLTTGDFNVDGKVDVALSNLASKDVRLLIGKGDGSYEWPAVVLGVNAAPYCSAAADLNGDGRDDLAYVSSTNQVTTMVNASPMVTGLVLDAGSIGAGRYTIARATLSNPAPLGGLTVRVSASTAVAIVPDTVLVPAGAQSLTFVVAGKATGQTQVTAAVNGGRSAALSVF